MGKYLIEKSVRIRNREKIQLDSQVKFKALNFRNSGKPGKKESHLPESHL